MKHEYVKEHKIVRTESGDMVVSRYSILTTTRVCYRVYEPGSFTRSHSTITHFDGLSGWYGELVTRELPPEIEALPAGNARSEACHNYWHALELIAHAIILKAYPELSTNPTREISGGEISTTNEIK